MQFQWLTVLVAMIEYSAPALLSTGQCQQKIAERIDIRKLNGKIWYEAYEVDIPPYEKCMYNVFQTPRNGNITAISRTYTDTRTGQKITIQGNLHYNSNYGNYSVNLAGYPANGHYWLLDHTRKAVTFYMCRPLNSNQISETAWILVSNLNYANDPSVIRHSRNILENNGFCSSKLLKVTNTQC